MNNKLRAFIKRQVDKRVAKILPALVRHEVQHTKWHKAALFDEVDLATINTPITPPDPEPTATPRSWQDMPETPPLPRLKKPEPTHAELRILELEQQLSEVLGERNDALSDLDAVKKQRDISYVEFDQLKAQFEHQQRCTKSARVEEDRLAALLAVADARINKLVADAEKRVESLEAIAAYDGHQDDACLMSMSARTALKWPGYESE